MNDETTIRETKTPIIDAEATDLLLALLRYHKSMRLHSRLIQEHEQRMR